MATAKIVREMVTQKVARIQLTLTEGEADFLTAVLAMIGGHETKSPRKYQVRITNALFAATGLDYEESDAYRLVDHDYLNNIFFSTYPARPR